MSMMKKLTAAFLVVVLSLSLVSGVFAATSPVEPQDPANPNYDPATKTDTETISGAEIQSKIGNKITTIDVRQDPSNPGKTAVISTSKDEDGKKVTIDAIGDGKDGIFNNKSGQKFDRLRVKGASETVTINAYAFKKSKVKKIALYNQKTKIKANAFKGIKQKKVVIYLRGAKKASDVKVAKGSFNGLGKDAHIVVSKKMDQAEFKKLESKLKAAGFNGKITRK